MQEEYQKAWAAIVLESLIISVLSNTLFGGEIGNISCKYTLSYSPSSSAFGIWLLIYGMAFLSVFLQLQTNDCNGVCADSRANLLFAVAWFFAALWTPAFVMDERWSIVLSAILLFMCASFALSAVMVEDTWRTTESGHKRLNSAAFSLLAGWTMTAFALSVGIAVQALLKQPRNESCELTEKSYTIMNSVGDPHSFPAPLLLAIPIAALGVWLKDPVLPLAPAWGIFWMRYTGYNFVALFLLCCSSATSLVMVFV